MTVYENPWAKSYSYLRTAMVGLLVALGVAVFYQAWTQHFHVLSSVSAYYYTPAQGIFVGSLIGLGAAMIALLGISLVEDVFLNLGGMFAMVVAIVPTSRGSDYRTAVRACQQVATPLLTERSPTASLDCPTVTALATATKANIENNMSTLLVVGVLGILATLLFARRHRETVPLWAFAAALLVFLAEGVTFLAARDFFIDNAHFASAIGLLVCVVVVALVNARRSRDDKAVKLHRNGYAWIALSLVVAAVLGTILMLTGVIALFWVEIVVALLFAVFWMVQTVEQARAVP
ncbi:MAG: hypothetical protein QOC94_86 [Actinoplanes sp.]|jgi:hypothetical protein|nr:hypothetical protein [Actinoplanes sp.]